MVSVEDVLTVISALPNDVFLGDCVVSAFWPKSALIWNAKLCGGRPRYDILETRSPSHHEAIEDST